MQLAHRIDFMALISVCGANPNGDPARHGMPRTDDRGCGVISPVCIKRKLRDRLYEMGESIFVSPPQYSGDVLMKRFAEIPPGRGMSRCACEKWYDVRAFGQTFVFPGVRCPGVRGAVTIQPVFSADPVKITAMSVTQCIGSVGDGNRQNIGIRRAVSYGLYVLKGSVNAFAAERSGFTEEDSEKLRLALLHIFDGDSSAARPAGSMEVERLYWWRHSSKMGEYSPAKVFATVGLKLTASTPHSFKDYIVTHSPIEGLVPEIYE